MGARITGLSPKSSESIFTKSIFLTKIPFHSKPSGQEIMLQLKKKTAYFTTKNNQ